MLALALVSAISVSQLSAVLFVRYRLKLKANSILVLYIVQGLPCIPSALILQICPISAF